MKDNNKNAHLVGHSKLKPLDLEYFYKWKILINELEASLTGGLIKQLDSVMKKNPDLLQVAEWKITVQI